MWNHGSGFIRDHFYNTDICIKIVENWAFWKAFAAGLAEDLATLDQCIFRVT